MFAEEQVEDIRKSFDACSWMGGQQPTGTIGSKKKVEDLAATLWKKMQNEKGECGNTKENIVERRAERIHEKQAQGSQGGDSYRAEIVIVALNHGKYWPLP